MPANIRLFIDSGKIPFKNCRIFLAEKPLINRSVSSNGTIQGTLLMKMILPHASVKKMDRALSLRCIGRDSILFSLFTDKLADTIYSGDVKRRVAALEVPIWSYLPAKAVSRIYRPKQRLRVLMDWQHGFLDQFQNVQAKWDWENRQVLEYGR